MLRYSGLPFSSYDDCLALARRWRRRFGRLKPALLAAACFALGALVTAPLGESPREACHRFWGEALAHDWCDDQPTGLVCITGPGRTVRGAGCIVGVPTSPSDE